MPSNPVWHRIKTFVCPSGKRRKTKRTTSRTDATAMPERPAYPPKPVRPPVAALPAGASVDMYAIEQRIMKQVAEGHTGEMLRSFADLYRGDGSPRPTVTGRVSITPPPVQDPPRDASPDPVTRVVLRSDDPEMDRTIVTGVPWLPKVLVRPEDVRRMMPSFVPAPGLTGMRLSLPAPVKAPVDDRTPSSGVSLGDAPAGASTAVLERVTEDTQDLLITDEWREMFRTETAHVCRSCWAWARGVMTEDGRWVCGRCLSAGRY
jgi:hypothetical protein